MPMKVVCFGGGAIGAYIGGSLALAGNEVTFVERPDSAPVLSANGIRLETRDGTRHHVMNFRVFDNFTSARQAAGPFHLALLAVKSFDTDALLTSLEPERTALPPFLSLQNGVENEVKLEAFLGRERVIPASVCTAISRGEQGLVKVEKLRGIGIADGFPLSAEIADVFSKAGLKAELIANATGMKWSKMLSNLMANASSAILNMTPAEIFSDPTAYRLEVSQLRETLLVMRAYQIPPTDIPGIPIRLLCTALRYFPDWLMKPVLKKSVGSGRGGKMPSFYIDLHAGKKQSEVEYLNGAVVRYAAKKGIPVPVNCVFLETLRAMAAGDIPWVQFDHRSDKLARLVSSRQTAVPSQESEI